MSKCITIFVREKAEKILLSGSHDKLYVILVVHKAWPGSQLSASQTGDRRVRASC